MTNGHPLDRAWGALMPVSDRIEHLTSLVWLRQLSDPRLGDVAGFDPRRLIGGGAEWGSAQMEPDATWLAAQGIKTKNALGWALDRLSEQVNASMFREDVLVTGWEKLSASAVASAVECVGKWRADAPSHGGDLLGEVLQIYRPGAAANGAFYTPWPVCVMMAKMTGPVKPGQKVLDPCVGSGRMLLAALQECRAAHDGGEPQLFGTDIDAQAVRACKMNLVLAGYGVAASAPVIPLRRAVAARGTEDGDAIYRAAQLQMFVDEPTGS